MSAVALVFETTGRWAAALRREKISPVHETRSIEECRRELEKHPDSFLVFEVRDETVLLILELLTALDREYPSAAAAVCLPPEGLADAVWWRQFGAIAVCTSTLESPCLASVIGRHLGRFPAGPGDLTARILSELPWSGGVEV